MKPVTLKGFERHYSSENRLVMGEDGAGPHILESMKYAVILLDRGDAADRRRASDILRSVSALQFVEPEWRYGHLPVRPVRNPSDRNSNCFLMPFLLKALAKHGDQLPTDVEKEFSTVVERDELRSYPVVTSGSRIELC
jgi:hypothetical protein